MELHLLHTTSLMALPTQSRRGLPLESLPRFFLRLLWDNGGASSFDQKGFPSGLDA